MTDKIKNHNRKRDNKNRDNKNRDRISVSILGIVIYSLVLVCIMAVAFVLVKSAINAYKAQTNNESIEDTITDTDATAIEDEAESEEDVISEMETEDNSASAEEAKPYEHLVDISQVVDSETGVIDYSKVIFEPGERNNSLQWEDTVFSAIENVSNPAEALVNSYDFVRLNEKMTGDKNVEYRVYTNPEGYIAKITQVSDAGGGSQVCDYYFDNGSINYIAQYSMAIEKPVNLTSTDIESRYYFNSDTLVRYIYCHDSKATEYSLADLSSYSEGTVEQYDYLEKDMINRAYITYNIGKSLTPKREICGYVLDECAAPISEAIVTITSDELGAVLANTRTNGDGYYSFTIDATDDTGFTVSANTEGVSGSSVYGVTALRASGRFCVAPIYLGYESSTEELNAQLTVKDAMNAQNAISDAEVKVRSGINNKDGKTVYSGKLDGDGSLIIPLATGSYTAEVNKDGYETAYIPVIVRSDRQTAVGFMVPKLSDNTYECVLSWETTPLDLDLKAVSSDQARVIKSQIDSLGVTNAEVVTIDNAGIDTYRLFAEDYGGISTVNNMSYGMSDAHALLSVYGPEGFMGNFHVPCASAGIIWEGVQIYSGKVLAVNNYYHGIEDSNLWSK